MSNAIIKQDGPHPVVADNVWVFRFGAGAFAIGVVAGVVGAVLAARRSTPAHKVKAPTPVGWPVNIAHRGGSALAPENTVEAFQEAARIAGVVLELDARTVAGGEVVVIHDDTVNRTTNGAGPLVHKSLVEVQRLDAGHRFTPDRGMTYPFRGHGVQVPTLEEIYQRFPHHPVVIELKEDRPGAAESLWSTVESAGAQERTMVATNTTALIKRFRSASEGTVATAASVGEFAVFWGLSLVHLQRLYKPPFQALQPPEVYKGIRVVTPRFIRKAHDSGLRVDVWTVNEGADMRRLLGWGVDGIMTDRPDVLAQVIRDQGAVAATM
jgi:glycerophosphoryl diester phosphodiesterase